MIPHLDERMFSRCGFLLLFLTYFFQKDKFPLWTTPPQQTGRQTRYVGVVNLTTTEGPDKQRAKRLPRVGLPARLTTKTDTAPGESSETKSSGTSPLCCKSARQADTTRGERRVPHRVRRNGGTTRSRRLYYLFGQKHASPSTHHHSPRLRRSERPCLRVPSGCAEVSLRHPPTSSENTSSMV